MTELFPAARDLMARAYLAVAPGAELREAVAQLEAHAEDTAFVVDEAGRLTGLLTERECLHTLAARAFAGEAGAETVAEVMIECPHVIAPGTDPYAIAEAFHSCGCSVLPVVEDGTVLGAVSRLTVLRAFLAVFEHRVEEQQAIERTADDLKDRPTAIERMQRVFAHLDREQLAALLRRRR